MDMSSGTVGAIVVVFIVIVVAALSFRRARRKDKQVK